MIFQPPCEVLIEGVDDVMYFLIVLVDHLLRLLHGWPIWYLTEGGLFDEGEKGVGEGVFEEGLQHRFVFATHAGVVLLDRCSSQGLHPFYINYYNTISQ
jgi:hypothetical protein